MKAERLAEDLTALWSKVERQPTFDVDGPVKLTEFIDGRFHKKGFIGEETLVPIGAYVGKTALILKFRELGSASGHIEMTVKEAREHLAGFAAYYIETLNNLDDMLMAEHREVAKAKEDTADMEARRVTNPLFGSW